MCRLYFILRSLSIVDNSNTNITVKNYNSNTNFFSQSTRIFVTKNLQNATTQA